MTAGPDHTEPDFEHAIIVRPIRCRRCGYDLRGLHIHSRCPECGLDTWTTILNALDPAASRLPRLRNPRRVGDGLVWLVACIFIATILIVARPFALRLDAVLGASGEIADWFPRLLMPMAGVVLLLALLSAAMLAPPRGQEAGGAVWRDIWLLTVSLLVWAMLAIVSGSLLPLVEGEVAAGTGTSWRTIYALTMVVHLAPAILVLWALRKILDVIGERSREYRTARGGRQRVRDLIVAALGMGVGQVTALAGLVWDVSWLQTMGTVIVWVTMLMLAIGGLYLVVNAWWIRNALRRPPLTLEELVTPVEAERAGDGEEAVGRRADRGPPGAP